MQTFIYFEKVPTIVVTFNFYNKSKNKYLVGRNFTPSSKMEISFELKLSEKEKSKECKWFKLRELNNITKEIGNTTKIYAKSALLTLTNA